MPSQDTLVLTDWMSTEELSAYLKVHPSTIRKLISNGRLKPDLAIGNRFRFNPVNAESQFKVANHLQCNSPASESGCQSEAFKMRKKKKVNLKKGQPQNPYPGITDLGDGRFKVLARTSLNGHRVKKEATVVGSIDDAIARQHTMLSELKKGIKLKQEKKYTVNGYFEHWLNTYLVGRARGTVYDYRQSLTQIATRLGDKALKDVTREDIQLVFNWFYETGRWNESTLRVRLGVLSDVFKTALEDGFVKRNPCRGVSLPKPKPVNGKRATAYTVDEIKHLIESIKEAGKLGVISKDKSRLLEFLLFTGMRKGESLALRWNDISNSTITISRSLTHRYEHSTKSGRSRTVACVGRVKEILNEQRAYLEAMQHPHSRINDGLVFPSKRSGQDDKYYLSDSMVNDILDKLIARYGLKPFCVHTLRKFNLTLERVAKVDSSISRKTKGWASEQVMVEHYALIASDELAKAALQVQDLLGYTRTDEGVVCKNGTVEVIESNGMGSNGIKRRDLVN